VATLEVGRVCVKTAGREAGKYCVVLKKMDENFVLVTGPKELTGVKRRRCNVEQLESTPFILKITSETGEGEIIKAFNDAGVLKKFELKKPSPELVKEAEKRLKEAAMKPKKEEKPKEKAKEEIKKEEKKIEEKSKEVKKEEVKEEKKEGIKLKLKIPSLRKGKKEEKKEEKPKEPEKKEKKKE
jgi:large subunit ribosomal protein L14e